MCAQGLLLMQDWILIVCFADTLFCLWKLFAFHIIKTLFEWSVIELVLIFFTFSLCISEDDRASNFAHIYSTY